MRIRCRHLVPFLASSTAASFSSVPPRPSLRIAVVGDIHGQWDDDDQSALLRLKPDLALLVGDFGNEDVGIVRALSKLQEALPVASILGNHDACFLGRGFASVGKRPPSMATAAPGSQPRLGSSPRFDALREQHELLRPSNVGWGRADFQSMKLSVAGGRPLSSGGPSMEKKQELYADLWGVPSSAASAALLAQHMDAAPEEHSLVVLAHNGPSGLGTLKTAPCGKDWGRDGGDWGDADLEHGLRQASRRAPLVVFGHMHERLQGGGKRTMVHAAESGTVYVNAAVVPRWRNAAPLAPSEDSASAVTSASARSRSAKRSARSQAAKAAKLEHASPSPRVERAFTLIELAEATGGERAVSSVEAVWVRSDGEVVERTRLYEQQASSTASPSDASSDSSVSGCDAGG